MVPNGDQVLAKDVSDTLLDLLDFLLCQGISPGLQKEHRTIPIYGQTGLSLGRSMEKPDTIRVLKCGQKRRSGFQGGLDVRKHRVSCV
jgi:hypothetical protein